jgi:hypothetical protein
VVGGAVAEHERAQRAARDDAAPARPAHAVGRREVVDPEQRVREQVPAPVGRLGRRAERRVGDDRRRERRADERVLGMLAPLERQQLVQRLGEHHAFNNV